MRSIEPQNVSMVKNPHQPKQNTVPYFQVQIQVCEAF